MNIKIAILSAACLLTALWARGQAMYFNSASEPDSVAIDNLQALNDSVMAEEIPVFYESLADSFIIECYAPDTLMSTKPLPRSFFLPAVFSSYQMPDTTSIFTPEYSGNPALRWMEDDASVSRRSRAILQRMVIRNPSAAPYNVEFLPESPKEWVVEVNPDEHSIVIRDLSDVEKADQTTFGPVIIKKKHWMRTFNASLQFSEAYISPNWYQGGNNNLNALLNLYYNVKLNQKYHPKLLFENTFQYKLGINNAPDDSLRNYNISQDIFQINTVFGIKARDKWYYSVTGQFKTQFLNNYAKNSNVLNAAFMSPATLTLGLGVTYNTTGPKYTFDASIAPLSYNLDICTNKRVDETSYSIDEGKHFKHSFGSSVECKLAWTIAYNIKLSSRLFAFTDYKSAYADWENTVVFEINRFLTTQLFVHFRYDTETPYYAEYGHWKKLQIKEILSLGFAYTFSTI